MVKIDQLSVGEVHFQIALLLSEQACLDNEKDKCNVAIRATCLDNEKNNAIVAIRASGNEG